MMKSLPMQSWETNQGEVILKVIKKKKERERNNFSHWSWSLQISYTQQQQKSLNNF